MPNTEDFLARFASANAPRQLDHAEKQVRKHSREMARQNLMVAVHQSYGVLPATTRAEIDSMIEDHLKQLLVEIDHQLEGGDAA